MINLHLILLLLRKIRDHTIEYRKDQTEAQCPPESINFKTGNEVIDQQDNTGIDYQEKKSQRDNGNWNRKEDEYWFHDNIGDRQYKGYE